MSTKNTMPESFDYEPGEENLTQEDILMDENAILQGMIEAGREREDSSTWETIEVRRAGKLYFRFRIRPITEEESVNCHKQATKYAPRKRGQPVREIETNGAKFRSWVIYSATVDEDRKKVWDNKKVMDHYGVLQGVDLIDICLLPGEKDRIIDRINDISGYGDDLEDTAKN